MPIHILLVIPAKIILIIPSNKDQGPLLQKLLFPAPLLANYDNNYSKPPYSIFHTRALRALTMGSYYQSFNSRKLLPASLFVRMRHRNTKQIAEDHSAARWQLWEKNCNLLTLHPELIWTGNRKSILEARVKRVCFWKWAFPKGAVIANAWSMTKFWKRLNDAMDYCIGGEWINRGCMCLLTISISPLGCPLEKPQQSHTLLYKQCHI